MDMKNHILTALREQFTRWEGLLSSMSEAQIAAPHLPSPWTTKDDLAHLRAWQQRSIARLEAGELGRAPDYPRWPAELDPDGESVLDLTNAWIYETNRDLPWSTVYANWHDGFLRFLEVGAGISETDLLAFGKYPWLKGRALADTLLASYDHHQEHIDQLLAWLQVHGSDRTSP